LARTVPGARGALAVMLLAAMFLGIAVWNGFPLTFYDTGGYMVEGLSGAFLVERSPVYSLLLWFTAAGWSLWLVVMLQAAMTAWLIGTAARIEVPGLTPGGLIAIGACLMGLTGIGWYVGQVEPDCMTGLVVLGCYLLLFRGEALGHAARALIVAIVALAVASHPSHLGLAGGLIIAAILLRIVPLRPSLNFIPLRPSLAREPATFGRQKVHWTFCLSPSPSPSMRLRAEGEEGPSLLQPRLRLPRPRLWPALLAFLLALALMLAANFALTRQVFVSRSGPVFLFARLMQDGIVKRLLDDTCPPPGSRRPPPYRLCAWRHHLSRTANEWLWGPGSAFHAEGGFQHSGAEDERIILDSLRRYPLMHVKAAVYDSVLQFFMFRTGDGIESQVSIFKPGLERLSPRQVPAYLAARQQRQHFRFRDLNMLHVTVGMLSLLGLLLLLQRAAARDRWDEAALPGLVLLALIGNAIICGTFSNPHDRYQSRLIWLPVLVLLLARARDPGALRPAGESGT